MQIYFVRHQAAGVLYGYPFTDRPTVAQLDALTAHCRSRHGDVHPKTGEPYWSRVVAVDVLAPDDMPMLPEAGGNVALAAASAQPFAISGVGHVRNP